MDHASPIVFVVDDDVSVCSALALLLASVGWQVQTFHCAEAFLRCPRVRAPSCLVLDLSLPEIDGLELQRRIRSERTDLPIVFISGYGDVPTTVQAMRGGALDFLTKPLHESDFLSAVETALRDSRHAIERDSELRFLGECYATLSERERQVISLVVKGLMNKQVAGELGISEITVKAHRGRAMRKMKARSLADMVKLSARLDGAGAWQHWVRQPSATA